MRFLQNHKNNYGPSCKPKNSTLMKQLFCQLQKALLLRMFQTFSKIRFFLVALFFYPKETKNLYEILQKLHQLFLRKVSIN